MVERFFGIMRKSEVEIEKRFKDNNGYIITIQANNHGWTIIYADGGCRYNDIDESSDNNFNTAYHIAEDELGKLIPYNS